MRTRSPPTLSLEGKPRCIESKGTRTAEFFRMHLPYNVSRTTVNRKGNTALFMIAELQVPERYAIGMQFLLHVFQ